MPKNTKEWLSWLIKLRIVVVTTLLGVSLGFASIFANDEALTRLFQIITASYVVSFLHYLFLRHSKKYPLQGYVQTFCDQLMICSIIYVTGGIDSYFSFLYLLSIIMSSILLYRRGALITATVSSLLTIGLYLLVQLGLLSSTASATFEFRTVRFIIGTNIFAFYAVAYLSSHLSESLRRTGTELEDKLGKLANLQAFNENIINSMRGGLLTTNLDGFITLFNKSASEITGHKPERIIGTHARKVFGFLQEEGQVIPCNQLPMRFEKSIKNANGKEIYLGVTVSQLLVEANRHIGYVYTFQDLTEIKELEEQVRQKEQMAAIGRMAAGIAHEIRNPLTAISGSFHLLKAGLTLDEDQRRLMDNISLETKRLYKIITDFLSYARPIKFTPRLVDLKQLTKDTVDLFRNSPEVTVKHMIEYSFEANNSLYCQADPDLIRQVLWNLCNNAVKAMPEGGMLSISLESTHEGKVAITFRDTGHGFTSEEQDKIFEPFQSSFRGGIGLGLSIVSQIVEAHHGLIQVSSSQGQGTTFQIALPQKAITN
jgi:two-component system sensor histidine kinase PilS (NtrC family)